jgi:hypothetical protein
MVAMAYDGALRREELVQIEIDDLEPAYSLIHLRAENNEGQTGSRRRLRRDHRATPGWLSA